MRTEERGNDQIHFIVSGNDNSLSESLTDDSEGIVNCSKVGIVPPINTLSFVIPTEFATEILCDSISKENNFIPPLNTDTLKLYVS